MNLSLRLLILAGCLAVCASGFTNVERAPLTVAQLETLIRRDETVKSPRTRIEVGAVELTNDTAYARVVLVPEHGRTESYIYKLVPARHAWKIAGAQRLWFVSPSRMLRGIRI